MFHQSCIKLIDPLQIFDTVLFSNHCAVWEETVRGVGASGEDGGLWPDGAPVSRQLPRLDQVHGSPSGVLRDWESSGRGREGTQDHFIQVTTKLFDDERVMRFTATIYFCLYIILYRNLIGIIYFWYIKRYVGVIINKKLYAFFWWGGGDFIDKLLSNNKFLFLTNTCTSDWRNIWRSQGIRYMLCKLYNLIWRKWPICTCSYLYS